MCETCFLLILNIIKMKLRITCLQTDIVAQNPEANRRHIDELLYGIEETDLIVLPETFTTGFPADAEIFAEDENGDTFCWLREKSADCHCVMAGTFITKEGKMHYNTFVIMFPDGNCMKYHKHHTFKMGGEKDLDEGDALITFELKGWKIRPFVCYDLRFPVWNRNKYDGSSYEYDIAMFTANWPAQKSLVWNTLLIARAIENVAYVIGVNRVGVDHNDIPYIGESMILNAKGRPVVKAGDKEEIISAVLDKEDMESFRDYFTVSEDWDRFTFKNL